MSGNFVDGRGNLKRTWKVRELSGLLLQGRICSLAEQILSFKSNPQI